MFLGFWNILKSLVKKILLKSERIKDYDFLEHFQALKHQKNGLGYQNKGGQRILG